MVAYAARFKIDQIKLFYPDTVSDYYEKESEIIIKDELADGREINVRAYQLPIINRDLFNSTKNAEIELTKKFYETKIKLIERLKGILMPKEQFQLLQS
jgi:5-methylcytosine-specific restriction enzyme subunit McrC